MKIPCITFPYDDLLNNFFSKAHKQLVDPKNIIEVNYPEFSGNWDTDLIKEINPKAFDAISKKAGVYAIFSRQLPHEHWQIEYIGQTTREYSKQRLTNHLITKHKDTGAKLSHVKYAVKVGKRIGFSFLQIEPAELRHFVEEKLIKAEKNWNGIKEVKNSFITKHFC